VTAGIFDTEVRVRNSHVCTRNVTVQRWTVDNATTPYGGRVKCNRHWVHTYVFVITHFDTPYLMATDCITVVN